MEERSLPLRWTTLGTALLAPMMLSLVASCVGTVSEPAGAGEADEGRGAGGGPLVCRDAAPPTPLRRLTRLEYRNSIRDLFGENDESVTSGFLRDERIGHYSSNLTAPVSEVGVERYLATAEVLASRASSRLGELLSCDLNAPDTCARSLLDRLARRIYRRRLEPDERARYEALVGAYTTSRGFDTAARIALQTMLQSPHFLYHVEGIEAPDERGVARLDAHAIAERLAFFLWRSTPDDALLDAAENGELATEEGVRAQVRRLLQSPRAVDTIAVFHEEWLALHDFDRISFDVVDGSIGPELRDAIAREPSDFVRHVLNEGDGRFSDLLTAPYTLGSPLLASFYGADAPGDDAKIALEPGYRAGLLTQAAVLAVHRSPVLRGKLVREQFFCQHVQPPPPGVDTTPPEPDPNASMRDQWIRHSSDPACKGCHELMDPIGFGFLHFDEVGRFRDRYGAFPVDASGSLRGTRDADGTFDGVPELAHRLAESGHVHRCVAEQWLTFALGRALRSPDESSDRCFVEAVYQRFAASDFDVRALLEAVATHPYFLHVLVESP